jgi:predicted transcriptional regulator
MTKKRIGRPMKKAASGRLVSMGMKVPASLKERLDAAAIASGRTQGMEAAARIERSFDHEWIVSEIAKLLGKKAT